MGEIHAMTTILDETHNLCQEHLSRPQVGDYWHEMFAPVCVVVGKTDTTVTICKNTKSVDDEHWTWNTLKIEVMSLDDFKKWLCYESDSMKDKTWCHVIPEAHKWVRDFAIKDLFGD